MPGCPEILLGTAMCFEYILVPIFHAIYDVIDTYLSLRYICYNYCGPVYIKLNFEALRVLRRAICKKNYFLTHYDSSRVEIGRNKSK